jgi:hypothetical protein
MAEHAAHLVDHMLPAVPIRQWVLSLPHRLRYLLAWDHGLTLTSLQRLKVQTRSESEGETDIVSSEKT